MRKYRNKPQEIDGEKYSSKREAKRHQELLLLQKAGKIAGLTREVPFILAPSVKFSREQRRKPALTYRCDFLYTTEDGRMVVEDAKGVRTDVYRVKKHLMLTVHGIEIEEV